MKQVTSIFYAVLFLCLICIPNVFGVEVYIPASEVAPEQSVNVPVKIDRVKNLAGVKIILTYDRRILEFIKAEKSDQAASLMHVVNSKTPGKLIVVMAGAKGIKGKEFPIVILTFKARSDLTERITETHIDIREIQLMNDQLKELESTTTIHPVKIVHGRGKKK